MARFLGRSLYLNAMFSYWHYVQMMKLEFMRRLMQTEQRVCPQCGSRRGMWCTGSKSAEQLRQFIFITVRGQGRVTRPSLHRADGRMREQLCYERYC